MRCFEMIVLNYAVLVNVEIVLFGAKKQIKTK